MVVSDTGKELCVELNHNGAGMTNRQAAELAAKGEGHGLRSCHERAQVLKAKINYVALDRCSCVQLSIPFGRE
jgi:signal transduction histidine kinase